MPGPHNHEHQWGGDPGVCRNQKCYINGPRCLLDFCVECCTNEHHKIHSAPAKVGEYLTRPPILMSEGKMHRVKREG